MFSSRFPPLIACLIPILWNSLFNILETKFMDPQAIMGIQKGPTCKQKCFVYVFQLSTTSTTESVLILDIESNSAEDPTQGLTFYF